MGSPFREHKAFTILRDGGLTEKQTNLMVDTMRDNSLYHDTFDKDLWLEKLDHVGIDEKNFNRVYQCCI